MNLYKIQTWETVRPPVRQDKWYVLFEHQNNSKSDQEKTEYI